MLEEYIYHGSERLRCGYTTGSCAAAAAKASAYMLLTGEKISSVNIMTPKGIPLDLEVCEPNIIKNSCASCGIIKDSGDDPDITNGIMICASAELTEGGIEITGGKGIGIVTKPGLDRPVGEYAINTIPRKMITEAVSEVCELLEYHGGIRITITVPNGEDIAKKTYNVRMGIEGGISIIGTTGIVEPMSSSALKDTIRGEERMRRAEGKKQLLITVGNYSKSFLAEKMPFMLDHGVMSSNYIGEAVEYALEYGFEGVLIIGHAGKLVKLGAGIMNTHSAQADGRMDVLVTCGVLAGADNAVLRRLPECVTVDAAFDILDEAGCLERVWEILMNKIQYYLDAKVKNEIPIGAVVFSYKYGIIGKTSSADKLIGAITEEYNG